MRISRLVTFIANQLQRIQAMSGNSSKGADQGSSSVSAAQRSRRRKVRFEETHAPPGGDNSTVRYINATEGQGNSMGKKRSLQLVLAIVSEQGQSMLSGKKREDLEEIISTIKMGLDTDSTADFQGRSKVSSTPPEQLLDCSDIFKTDTWADHWLHAMTLWARRLLSEKSENPTQKEYVPVSGYVGCVAESNRHTQWKDHLLFYKSRREKGVSLRDLGDAICQLLEENADAAE